MIHNYALFQDSYGTPEMRRIWSESNMVQKWLDYEKAIAIEMAHLGMIPEDAAKTIASKSSTEYLTPEMIAEVKSDARHVMVSMIKAFAEMCGPAGEHYHLGPTTQDIMLTGLTLQIKDAYQVVMRELRALEHTLVEQSLRYKTIIMTGRTHAQHGVPLTFGFILATWAYEIRDHIERFKEIADRLFQAKLSAAVGTRNTWVFLFGVEKTQELVKNVAKRVGLGVPPVDIATRSDRMAEIGFALANLIGSLAKMGLDIRFLQGTEVQEVEEPWDRERQYSSSTMPHKRNPERSEWPDGLAKIARGNSMALASITVQNERDGTWVGPTLKCIPDNFLLASAALANGVEILGNLQVHEDRMRENLDILQGINMSEAVMLRLWEKTGKKVLAHALVHNVSMAALDDGTSLKEALLADEEAMRYLTAEEIDEITDPKVYVGDAAEQVEATAAYIDARRREEGSPSI